MTYSFLVRSLAGAAILGSFAMLGGCGKGGKQAGVEPEEPAAGSSARSSGAPKADVPSGDADLLQNVAVGTAATNVALLEGDAAWQAFLQAMRPPPTPPEWETNAPSKEAIAQFQKQNGMLALKVADLAKDFYTKYPKHERAGEARDREQYLLGVAVESGVTNVQARLATLEEARLKDPDLSEDDRLQLRVAQLQRQSGEGTPDMPARLESFEKGARALIKEFPKRQELTGLLSSLAQGWADLGKLDKARALSLEVGKGDANEETKAEAASLLKKLDRVGKPLAIKFKAVDGRDVSLGNLKGKVVLVDFWATWCGPCMAELPNVKATYEKLNAKGFEIVGISLDQEKAALQNVVNEKRMAWPQYFEEAADGNKMADEFEVASIPTMWLVDKQGNLRDLNGRENLAEKVEKLLAE